MSGGKAAKLLREITRSSDNKIHVCKVVSVTGAKCNAMPVDGTAEFTDVRLNAVTSGSAGIIITPAVDSIVVVNQISTVDSYISQFSEIEKIEIEIGDFKIVLNGNEMVFNNGDLGLPKIDKLVERINRLEDKLKSHQHGYVTFPSGSAGPLNLTVAGSTPGVLPAPSSELIFLNTERNELEDTKIKH